MENKHYSQQLSPERNGKQLQSLPLTYPAMLDEDDEGGLELGELLAAVRRKILVVASVTTVVASGAVALALTSTPTYVAKFELLTEPVTIENKLTTSSLNEENTEKQTYEVDQTELMILLSPKVMSPIVKQIEARYPGSGSPQLNIKPIENTNILEVSYQDLDPAKVRLVLDLVSNTYLNYSLEQRRADIRQGIQYVEAQLPQLQRRVTILEARLQNFRQQYDVTDPRVQGQQLSNQLSTIVQQRLDTQTILARLRALYATLQSQLGLQPNDSKAAEILSKATRYQNLLNQLQDLETKIAVESARYREDSPIIKQLRVQQQNLLPLVEQEGQRVLGNKLYGTIGASRDLGSRIGQDSLRTQQIRELFDTAKQIQALEAQKQALSQAESLLKQQFKQFPSLARQNDDLERQLKIAVDNLNQFLTKREALRIEAAQKQVPWQLLAGPTEPIPSSVSVKSNLILGTGLGLLLGIGAALVVDKLSNFLYTSKKVKDTTRLLVLGEIPLKQKPKNLALLARVTNLIQWVGHKLRLGRRGEPSQQHNISHFWESLHSLYTNIRFLSFDTPVRSLAIISAAHKDGRSTIAVHLAQTAAAMGQRVLLVDADLRSPKLHTMLGLPNINGLSNVIATDLNFEDVIQRSRSVFMNSQGVECLAAPNDIREFSLEDNFFVLTAGQVPPNPTSLLSSQKMKNLAAQFQEAFDFIIYDTTPLLGLADSSLLAAHADASILVVGLGKTNRSTLVKVLEKLKISSTRLLGVVANGIKG